jgi:hypothetical protein
LVFGCASRMRWMARTVSGETESYVCLSMLYSRNIRDIAHTRQYSKSPRRFVVEAT